jgi:hypothetical protein
MNSRIKEIIKKNEIHFVLFNGYDESNKPFHAFIVTNGIELRKIENSKEPLILGNHSIVLYSNSGHDVPDYVTEAVTEGFKERFLKETA